MIMFDLLCDCNNCDSSKYFFILLSQVKECPNHPLLPTHSNAVPTSKKFSISTTSSKLSARIWPL